MIRRPPRSTLSSSSAASDVYKRQVLGEMVELPLVVLEGDARLVAGDRLPPVGVDAPVAHHLEVLDMLVGGGIGGVERVGEGDTRKRDLLEAPVGGGCLDAEGLVDGGDDVVDVVELVTQGAGAGDALGPVDDQRHVHPSLVGVLLVPLERGVAGLGPAPRELAWLWGPPMSSMRSTASSGVSTRKLKYFISCITPNGPPSWLAPLSDRRRIRVLSNSPRFSRADTSRPIWSSVCSRKAANASWRRAASRRWFRGRVSQASTPGFRGASSVSAGTTPMSTCRANQASRATSHPASKRPRYFSR